MRQETNDYACEMEAEEPGERPFLTIFMYPCNGAGLGRIALFTILLLAMAAVRFVLYSLLGPAASYLLMGLGFVNLLVGADFFFYLADCVRSSADGALRAPGDTFAMQGGLADIAEDFCKLIFPYLVCFLPAILYTAMTDRRDGVYWGLLAAGCFYFPMFLLAVVLFDAGPGFNPFLHVVSMVSTFFGYCLLVLEVILLAGLFLLIAYLFNRLPLTAFLVVPLELYFMIVFAHLLGRFYYRNDEKLRWEV